MRQLPRTAFDRLASDESVKPAIRRNSSKQLHRRGTVQANRCEPIGTALYLYLCRLEGVARSLIFDGNEYAERCLRPVRVGSVLPSLVDRYALDQRHLDMPDHELFGWIDQVVALWHRQADRGVVTIASVCAQLLAADEDLRATPGYREAEWWRDLIRGARPAAADLPASTSTTDQAAEPHRPAHRPTRGSGHPFAGRWTRQHPSLSGRPGLRSRVTAQNPHCLRPLSWT